MGEFPATEGGWVGRIIAGARGGQRLTSPDGSATRPTTDRVREAAFAALAAWLGASGDPGEQLRGVSFLDLYGGTGAVALEAASRGAAPVVCVESDAKAVAVIRKNVASTRLPVQVVASSVSRFLAQDDGGYDIVWSDPPYELSSEAVAADLATLLERGLLRPRALVVVERSGRSSAVAWPSGIGESWNRRYGETTLYFGVEGTP